MPCAAYQRSTSYKDAVEKHLFRSNVTLHEGQNGAAIGTVDPGKQEGTSFDVVDSVPPDFQFTLLDIIFTVGSIGTFIFDIITDIAVAVSHYGDGKMWYFGLTVVFIVVPMVTMTAFSFRWYLIDSKKKAAPDISCKKWVLIGALLVLQLTPLLRYGSILLYAYKARTVPDAKERRKYNKWLVFEDADAALLRLFECFLESAPQVVLQLYILASRKDARDLSTVYIQVVSMVVSVISLAWSLVAQHNALRLSQPDSANMSVIGRITQFFWRLFDIVARILALGLFVSLFPLYFAAVCAIRWIFMTLWIISMKTDFCSSKLEEFFYNVVLGGMFIFSYFNPKSGRTRWRYLIYYIYTFVENTALIVSWYAYSDPHLWYRLSAMFLHFLSFILCLFFLMTYYVLFHPNGSLLNARDQVYDERATTKMSPGVQVTLAQNPLDDDYELQQNAHEKKRKEYLKILSQCQKEDREVGTPV